MSRSLHGDGLVLRLLSQGELLSNFERELRKQMMKNVQGKKAEKATPCPYCGESFKLHMEAVMFGGEIRCPHCQETYSVSSEAADTLVSGLDDFRKSLEQINRRNRRHR
jgi:uncharacterized Zn-finger protein